MTTTSTHCRSAALRVAVIGSGFAGLGAAIQLRAAGFDDLVILERADDVGGVWRDNHYPGAACDVQSYLYSFSFAPNPGWAHTFSRQPEIHAYLRQVARDFDVERSLRLSCPVERAYWDAGSSVWRLCTPQGEIQAEHVVVATGALADPLIPDLPGLHRFTGARFHSSQWDHSCDLRGKRVAVIGTGASAIQFVPAVQPQVARLTLFQRTAPWVLPRHDHPIHPIKRALLATVPGLHLLQRALIYAQREMTLSAFRYPALMELAERRARSHLRAQVSDPQLRTKLTPDYRMGCKRILLSNDYLRSLDQPNAEVVTTGVHEVLENAIIDRDGRLHEADAIIFGTGFKTNGLPLTDRILGVGGTTMAQAWGASPRAHLGTMVAGFPNMYLMHGPNIGLGHTSVITMFESQIRYIIEALRYAAAHRIAAVEPTPVAQEEFAMLVDHLTDGSVWTSGGCSSWYLDASGRNSNLWPGPTFDYRRRARFRPDEHRLQPATPATTTWAQT